MTRGRFPLLTTLQREAMCNEFRALIAKGRPRYTSYSLLAERYGVHVDTVRRIIKGTPYMKVCAVEGMEARS